MSQPFTPTPADEQEVHKWRPASDNKASSLTDPEGTYVTRISPCVNDLQWLVQDRQIQLTRQWLASMESKEGIVTESKNWNFPSQDRPIRAQQWPQMLR